jgi:phospholipid-binding lipoprotein MlaA
MALQRIARLAVALALATLAAGCATSQNKADPWEGLNRKTHAFNMALDETVMKPVAKGYVAVVPAFAREGVNNFFDNLEDLNTGLQNILQGKPGEGFSDLGRLVVNSTFGFFGLWDVATPMGLEKHYEDFGQTLGVWGSGPGPYLVLPLMEPLTVRDGVGKFVDGLMDPLSYVLPFFWTRIGMKAGDTLNERALNYDLFQGFEESVIDMYSAVRHGYLQRRQQLIKE